MCSLSMCSGGQGGDERISRSIDENPAISSCFERALSRCATRGTTVALRLMFSRACNDTWPQFDTRDCASQTRGRDTMQNMITRLRSLMHDDEGQDLIEYALLAGLISLVAVGAITTAGTNVNGIFTKIGTKLSDANK